MGWWEVAGTTAYVFRSDINPHGRAYYYYHYNYYYHYYFYILYPGPNAITHAISGFTTTADSR